MPGTSGRAANNRWVKEWMTLGERLHVRWGQDKTAPCVKSNLPWLKEPASISKEQLLQRHLEISPCWAGETR